MTIMQLIILLGITLTPQQLEVVTLIDESKTNIQEIKMTEIKQNDEKITTVTKEKTPQKEKVKGIKEREDGLKTGERGFIPAQA